MANKHVNNALEQVLTKAGALPMQCPVCGRDTMFEVDAYRCAGCGVVADNLGTTCQRCGCTMFVESISCGDIICTSKGCGYSLYRRIRCLSLGGISERQ